MAHDLAHQFARLRTQAPRASQEQSWLSEGLADARRQLQQQQQQQPPPPPPPPPEVVEVVGPPAFDLHDANRPTLADQAIPETPYEEAEALAASQSSLEAPGGDQHASGIVIPLSRGLAGDGSTFDGSLREPDYFARATTTTTRTYRSEGGSSSISFDPEVTVDSGHRHALEVPLPRLDTNSQPRGRAARETVHQQELERQLSRARSDTGRAEYDPVTGERRSERHEGRRDHRYVEHQPRWPFLQSTVDELAHDRRGVRPRSQSPVPDTAPSTPGHASAERASPDAPRAPHGPTPIRVDSDEARSEGPWAGPASAPTPRRLASRSMSYSTERRSIRRQSRRNTSNSGSSPASAFLSRYFSQSPTVAPDGEGQEVGEYVLGREIGFGGFSVIREASTIERGEKVIRAVKIVRRQLDGRDESENELLQGEYEHEVEIWRGLSHEHILPLYAVYITDFATFAFTHLNTGGTLFDALRHQRQGLSPRRCRRYAYQVASAIRYLHEDMHLVHRDVKLENCLIDISKPETAELGGSILLCDFGLADYLGEDEHGPERDREPPPTSPSHHDHHGIGPSDTSTNFTGSLPYASPEMINAGRPILSMQSDIWAFGVVCFAMITGRLPFQHSFGPRVRMMILNGEYDRKKLQARERGVPAPGEELATQPNGLHADPLPNEPPRDPADGPPNRPAELGGATELVERCLRRSKVARWTIRDCLSSSWLEPEMDSTGVRPGWAM